MMKQDSFLYNGLFAFFIGGAIGLMTTLHSWNGMIYFYMNDSRKPAAIQRSFDFSNLKGSSLIQSSKERLITGAKIINHQDKVGVQLGNYLLQDAHGQKSFACNQYSTIEIEFTAVGMAESGHSPTLKVSGPCLVSGDLNYISTLWIPHKTILLEKAGDLELSFFDRQRLELSFSHMGTAWPKQWQLHSIKLVGEKKSIAVSELEIRSLVSHPPEMVW